MKRLLAALPLLALFGCTGSVDPVEPPTPLREFTAELTTASGWSAQVGEGTGELYLRLAPLVDGERIYAAALDGTVSARSAADGSRLWQVELERTVTGGVGDGGDLLLVGGDAEVAALDKASGEVRWRTAVSSEVLSAPVRADGLVLARTVDGNLYALDAYDGRQRWRYAQPVPTLSLRGTGRPQVGAGVVLAGFANGRLFGLELRSGKPLWAAAVGVPRGRTELERMVDVDADMALVDGIVFVASYQGRLLALTLEGGQALWARDLSSYTGIAFADNVLYLTDDAGDLWAVSARTGGTLWKQDALHARSPTAPVVQGDYLVAGDFDGYLHWFAREDGRPVARTRVGSGALLAPPQAVGPRVYAMNAEGRVEAVDVSTLEN